MSIKLEEILKFLKNEIVSFIGNPQKEITGVSSLENATKDQLTYCKHLGDKAILIIKSINAPIICHSDLKDKLDILEEKNIIFAHNPRICFIKVANHFFPPPRKFGIHPSALIGKNCIIGSKVYIGKYVTVGENVCIGNNTIIHAGVHIYNNVKIGSNCVIHSGVVIGADGFGYERSELGDMLKFPHYGGVIIGDNVEIGANTCIDRGTLGNTVIERGVKIDNLCHIAHNTIIKENSVIIALSMIGGSTIIGKRAWIAPSSCLRNGIIIGDDSVVGLGAVVTKDVPNNTTVIGVPAKPYDNK
ncbi:MAG: UDP-3-O-(3-hydroxymyristoyl)glucosamine N-acyltransferase [Candidatus Helarchaeota archaeon]